MRQRKTIILLILLTLGLVCSGCVTTSVYVLDQAEVVRVKEGETLTAKYSGWLLSDRAVDRILNVKIKGINLK